MAPGPIPPDVEQFVLDAIDTVPHLEALLLVFQSPQTTWTAKDTAARIYVSERSAAMLLEDLARRSLIAREPHASVGYRFDGGSAERAALLEKMAQCYRTDLISLTRLIHSNASGSVRDFARAFKLKREE
jgi:hypothetical protein